MAPCSCPKSGGDRRYEPAPGRPEDDSCDYCGSLFGEVFMARLEAGDVVLGPTDKNYKCYVHNHGGAPFRQTHRTDKPSVPGEILKDPMDMTLWTWAVRETPDAKFYFEHLSESQRQRFIELLNARKLKIGDPGHFYRLPFFVQVLP